MNRRTALQGMAALAATPWIGSTGRCFDERIKTGFPVLDFNTGGGLKRGGIYLIAGETGSGKSLLSGSIGQNAIQQGYRVATINLDANQVPHFGAGEIFTSISFRGSKMEGVWLNRAAIFFGLKQMCPMFDLIIMDGVDSVPANTDMSAYMKSVLINLQYERQMPVLIMQTLLKPDPLGLPGKSVIWNQPGASKYQFANAVFKVKRPSYGGDFNYRCSTIKNRYYPSYATQFLRLDLENKRFTPDALRYPVL